jgi:hypothetical protein
MSTQSSLQSGAAALRRRLDPVWRRVRARFEVDTRALAAVRILLGLTLLGDLLYRALYFEMFYTDSGVYPLSTAEVSYTQFNGWSLHLLSGELWFQQLLFVLAGLFAVAFIIGYRTRLVGFVSLVLLFSLHGRNPAVLNGGDRLLRVLLLVALVAPLGERWSVDALRRGSARKTVASFGTAALLAQPLAVFVANAIEKHKGETWYTGDGLEIAMRNDTMSIFLGDVLTDFPGLMTLLNYMWIGLLAGSLVLLLLPVGRLRALAALAYLGAFAGMGLTMSVGVFPYALAASVIPYLTPPFWDLLARFVPRRWTNRLPSASRFGPLGRSPLEHRLLDRIRSAGYRSVADYTGAYARSLLTIAGLLMLVWIVLFTAVDLGGYDIPGEDSQLDQQTWGLYAPDPSEGYSWYITQAELSNGSTVDALDGGTVTFDRPPDAADEYDSFRHRKYLQTVRSSGTGVTGRISLSYIDWACEQATARYGETVESVELYQMYQPSPLDGSFDEEPSKISIVDDTCGG